jgi:hypothetical protein
MDATRLNRSTGSIIGPPFLFSQAKRDELRMNHHRVFSLLFAHDLRANAFAFVARENRCTLCANAALRVRIMLWLVRFALQAELPFRRFAPP